jgi:hypothetical protein
MGENKNLEWSESNSGETQYVGSCRTALKSGWTRQSNSVGSFWHIPIMYTVFRWYPLTGFTKSRSDWHSWKQSDPIDRTVSVSDVIWDYVLLGNHQNSSGQMTLDFMVILHNHFYWNMSDYLRMAQFHSPDYTVRVNIDPIGISYMRLSDANG